MDLAYNATLERPFLYKINKVIRNSATVNKKNQIISKKCTSTCLKTRKTKLMDL